MDSKSLVEHSCTMGHYIRGNNHKRVGDREKGERGKGKEAGGIRMCIPVLDALVSALSEIARLQLCSSRLFHLRGHEPLGAGMHNKRHVGGLGKRRVEMTDGRYGITQSMVGWIRVYLHIHAEYACPIPNHICTYHAQIHVHTCKHIRMLHTIMLLETEYIEGAGRWQGMGGWGETSF